MDKNDIENILNEMEYDYKNNKFYNIKDNMPRYYKFINEIKNKRAYYQRDDYYI
jgi:hypothetical protein